MAMFTLSGKPLALDAPFVHEDIQYPANWLRLASPEERAAIGIEEVPDPEPYDQRFYWGPGLPKEHEQLVAYWTGQTRRAAGAMLASTDWMVIREADNGTDVPAATKTWRQAIRDASEEKVVAIEATVDTDELAEYISGTSYGIWPEL